MLHELRPNCASRFLQQKMSLLRIAVVPLQILLPFMALTAPAASILLERRIEAAEQPASDAERCLRLQMFVRSDSALCQEALKSAEAFAQRREGICVEVLDVAANKATLERYWQTVQQFGVKKPRVPMFVACGRLKVGFHDEAASAADIEELFAIHAYIRPTCQHCRAAKQFLTRLATRWKGIHVVFHDIDHEPGAMQEMNELARRHGITAPAFPVLFVCGRVISGYRTDATTGRQIEDLLIKASSPISSRDQDVEPESKLPGTNGAPLPRSVTRASAWPILRLSEATLITYVAQQNVDEDGVPAADRELSLPSDAQPELPPVDDSTEEVYTAPAESPEGIDLPWIGYVRVRDLGLPAFTLLIGLIDGFNPCAMWVLVFLLSVLANVKDRRKIAAIAGTFVVVSGLAYFAFMAAWLNFFMLVGIARPLQIGLGVLAVLIGLINVKDFFAFKKGITLSIPESVKPGIYARVRRIVTTDYLSVAIGLSVMLAVLVNIVELMCTAGLPAVYTQILTLQQLPPWKNYAYLGLYNLGYMFDDSLMVIVFVVTLSHRKMRELEGRWLKLISGVVVLMLGFAILFRPDWLQW
jgi:glutaredoxin